MISEKELNEIRKINKMIVGRLMKDKRITIRFIKNYKQNYSPCWSCGDKECPKCSELMNSGNCYYNSKTKRFRMIMKCKDYKEQVFEIPKRINKMIRKLANSYADYVLMDKHNITQSGDGFLYMIRNIHMGLYWYLSHRKTLNDIKGKGEKYIEQLEK